MVSIMAIFLDRTAAMLICPALVHLVFVAQENPRIPPPEEKGILYVLFALYMQSAFLVLCSSYDVPCFFFLEFP